MSADIRKIVVQVDETHVEMGQRIDPPTRRVDRGFTLPEA